MKINSEQRKLVELFIKQENLIGKLYRLFAKRFPEHKQFWSSMSDEEHQHAAWIKRLTTLDTTDKFKFTQGELRSSSLAKGIEAIEGFLDEFINNDNNYPLSKAISIALHLENALWERMVFQCFEGDGEEVKNVMNTLHVGQKIHIKKLTRFAESFQNEHVNTGDK